MTTDTPYDISRKQLVKACNAVHKVQRLAKHCKWLREELTRVDANKSTILDYSLDQILKMADKHYRHTRTPVEAPSVAKSENTVQRVGFHNETHWR